MVSGRDVDFGIMLIPEYDGDVGEREISPIRLFGPCRRATSLSANVAVPQAGTIVLGFDNSGMWFSSKTVRFRARVGNGAVTGLTDL